MHNDPTPTPHMNCVYFFLFIQQRKPRMCIYTFIDTEFLWWGIQARSEQTLIKVCGLSDTILKLTSGPLNGAQTQRRFGFAAHSPGFWT